jgi:hypothetical protein
MLSIALLLVILACRDWFCGSGRDHGAVKGSSPHAD